MIGSLTALHNAMTPPTLMAGFMSKKIGDKRWEPRYFVLKGEALKYDCSKTAKYMRGTIDLNCVTSCTVDTSSDECELVLEVETALATKTTHRMRGTKKVILGWQFALSNFTSDVQVDLHKSARALTTLGHRAQNRKRRQEFVKYGGVQLLIIILRHLRKHAHFLQLVGYEGDELSVGPSSERPGIQSASHAKTATC
jgi:hypothetical protein